MHFFLMNKDIKVAEFVCEKFDDFEQTYLLDDIQPNLIPLAIQNGISFDKWLDSRLILSQRKHIEKTFQSLGLSDKAQIIQRTYGVSLNDTYWTKSVDNNEVDWDSVSPYSNCLNQKIADYAFDEKIVKLDTDNLCSPEFATSGNYPKCWIKGNYATYLVKGGSTLGINKGNEPFSELFADELLKVLGVEHIIYDYISYKGVDATRCANICDESVGISPFSFIRPDIKNFSELLDEYNHCEYLLDMFLFDYLSLNTDRHFGNISLFIQNGTQKVLGFTPIYDNNMAFLPYYMPNLDGDIDAYIDTSDENIVANDGTSFEDLFKMIDCKYVRNKIDLIKNFSFNSKYRRCDVANQVLQRQLSLIK